MANQFAKGHTFVPGEVVDPADLNNLVDLATAEPALITDQLPNVSATGTDKVMVNRAGVLHSALVSSLPSGVTSVNFNATPGTVFNDSVTGGTGAAVIALELADQTACKVLAGPVSGSAATPTFRVLSPVDLPFATVAIAVADIDWDLGVMFTKTLANNITFSFSHPSAGQTIRVLVIQDTLPSPPRTVTWPTGVRWPGGTNPVMSTGSQARDLYTFHFISGFYYGTFDQNFFP